MTPAFRLALACVAATAAGPLAAQPIYRCDDGKGGVLYADEPCRGGTRVEIQAGMPDPAAIERLRREQKAFDERQAVRDARAQAEAQAAAEARRLQRERERIAAASEPAPSWGYPAYAWGGYWPYVPVVPRPPTPPRPEPRASPASLPATPKHLPSPPPASPAPAPRAGIR